MPVVVRGSCLCGEIAWEGSGAFDLMSHCHCSMCRKVHGTAYATYVATAADGFRWLQGEDRAARYESSPGGLRPFCPGCGSIVPSPFGEHVFMAAGCLDDDPGARPQAHIFVGSKAPWYEIADNVPCFPDAPPGFEAPQLAPVPRGSSDETTVRGSCLCSGVAWEYEGRLSRIVNCHCRRCRKARSTAHATNLFGETERFRWLHGEELLTTFKVPDAERFSQVFCRVCSSPQPRVAGDRVGAPAGAIDGDPGSRPEVHIFVPFKAPWFEIADPLPQYEGYAPSPPA